MQHEMLTRTSEFTASLLPPKYPLAHMPSGTHKARPTSTYQKLSAPLPRRPLTPEQNSDPVYFPTICGEVDTQGEAAWLRCTDEADCMPSIQHPAIDLTSPYHRSAPLVRHRRRSTTNTQPPLCTALGAAQTVPVRRKKVRGFFWQGLSTISTSDRGFLWGL